MESDFGIHRDRGAMIRTYNSLVIDQGKMKETLDPPLHTVLTIQSIVELLMQMFWKQNRYAANNSNYGSKAVESRDTSLETPTPASESRHASSSTFEGRNDGRVRYVYHDEISNT